MRWLYSIAATLLMAGAASALDLPDCAAQPGSPDSCSPIVACMPGRDTYLVGRAVGWDAGTLSGVTNTGVSCTGTWRITGVGLGVARFACDDGLAGRLVYTYQDSLTGTAAGRGFIDGFGRLEAWSGHNIRPFLDRSGRAVDGELMCGAAPMLISRL